MSKLLILDEPTEGVQPSITPTTQDRWTAELHLRFRRNDTRTVLVENRHFGPLLVQKALSPEGEQIRHAIIIHPPGWIAGGDELTVEIDLEANSSAAVTAPEAAKWYKSPRRPCRQQTTIRIIKGSILDWLPQEISSTTRHTRNRPSTLDDVK